MSNAARTLQELNPKSRERLGVPRLLADFKDAHALIVLGDPGAGKTHLLREAAGSASVMTAKRAIAPSAKLPTSGTVLIDALDEVSGDVEEALDEIIAKLENAGAPPVRLTCRAQDWFGARGVKAFQDLYGPSEVRVCLLLPLDEAGAAAVLEGRVADPPAFLDEAKRRGLSGFLKNPNDLQLLSDAVKRGWPTSRTDLFEKATAVVLSEQNPSHQRRHNFQPEDLVDAAGWIAASVLLAGADDLAVDGAELAVNRATAFDHARVEAALKSRAFATTDIQRVQPAHRTVAEFLAGRWLAQAMSTAIQEERMRALLVGRDGVPPASLRGVFAWAVNFLTASKARAWLSADPVSLVLHGDVALLQTHLQVELLEVLATSAATDPDLGGWGEGEDRWGQLVTAGTAAKAEQLLLNPAVADIFKLRVLAGAALSAPPSALAPTFLTLAQDTQANDGVRARALEAYLATNADPAPALALFAQLNAQGVEDPRLHIRAALLRALPTLKAPLLQAAARAIVRWRNSVDLGRLSVLVRRLALADVEALLDGLLGFARRKRAVSRFDRPSQAELQELVVQAVSRLLKEAPGALTDARLVGLHKLEVVSWFSTRPGLQKQLVALGARSTPAAAQLLLTEVVPGDPKDLWSRYVHVFEINGLLTKPEALVGEVVARAAAEADPDLAAALCQCAAGMMMNQPMPDSVFESLYGLVTARAELKAVKDVVTVREPRTDPPWRQRQRADEAALEEAKANLAEAVRREHNALSAGNAPQLAQTLGRLYGGHFEGGRIGRLSEPAKFNNLIAGLDEAAARLAATALSAALPLMPFATPSQVAALALARQSDSRDLALLAAMDFRHAADPGAVADPTVLSDPLVGALLLNHLENGRETRDPYSGDELGPEGWPAVLLATRPQAAKPAFIDYVRPLLEAGAEHVAGLYQLAHAPEFEAVRQAWASEILILYPDPGATNSPELFDAVLAGPTNLPLLAAAPGVLALTDLSDNARVRWTTACWLLDPETYGGALRALLASKAADAAWAAVSMVRGGRDRAPKRLTEGQIALLLEALVPVFPYVDHPAGGWSGDKNPWDGTEFLNGLINALGATPTQTAAAFLRRFSEQPVFASYAQALLRASRAAFAAARDKEFEARDLRPISAALLGGPPADLQDAVATVVAELRELGRYYRTGPDTNWRKFWNLSPDQSANPTRLKPENECRNYILPDLQSRLAHYQMRAEELTANNDRIDLVAEWRSAKIPVEVKIDDNAELWVAAHGQLSARYLADYGSGGYGVYLVIWSNQGRGRGRSMPTPPAPHAKPTSPQALEALLTDLLSEADRVRVSVVVMDLHAPNLGTASPATAKGKKSKKTPPAQP